MRHKIEMDQIENQQQKNKNRAKDYEIDEQEDDEVLKTVSKFLNK